MLKLVYPNPVLGPIDLEYERPLIRVGSSEDNDLVLRHPSIRPYHCLLLFRGEKVILFPPTRGVPSLAILQTQNGHEFGLGETLTVGEVEFQLAHSSKTVAMPELSSLPARPESSGLPEDPQQPRFYCPHCRMDFPETQLRRVGLVGRLKRLMCPKCSFMFDIEHRPAAPPPPPPKKRARR